MLGISTHITGRAKFYSVYHIKENIMNKLLSIIAVTALVSACGSADTSTDPNIGVSSDPLTSNCGHCIEQQCPLDGLWCDKTCSCDQLAVRTCAAVNWDEASCKCKTLTAPLSVTTSCVEQQCPLDGLWCDQTCSCDQLAGRTCAPINWSESACKCLK